jgi:hypothetical protein
MTTRRHGSAPSMLRARQHKDAASLLQEGGHVPLQGFPRYPHDGVGFTIGPPYWPKPARAAVERVAQDLRSVLSAGSSVLKAERLTLRLTPNHALHQSAGSR